jgi:hypothetical protein
MRSRSQKEAPSKKHEAKRYQLQSTNHYGNIYPAAVFSAIVAVTAGREPLSQVQVDNGRRGPHIGDRPRRRGDRDYLFAEKSFMIGPDDCF